ncbi:MAG: RsiW-degrading membrane proteinase PrsW (M82 family) [Verrucomicrobiales bacterium]|jgi:RsiW-degrading membrane proteinase PrsW (M82 family)
MLGLSRQRLFSLSRNRDFLIRACSAIILVSVAFAVLLWALVGRNTGSNRLEKIALEAKSDPEAMAEAIREAPEILVMARMNGWQLEGIFGEGNRAPIKASGDALRFDPYEWVTSLLDESALPADQLELFRAYAAALLGDDPEAGFERQTELQTRFPDAPFANELLGDLLIRRRDYPEGLDRLRSELRIRPSEFAADELISRHLKQEEELQQLLADPEVTRAASTRTLLDARIALKDIGGILKSVLAYSRESYKPVYVGLGLFVAAVWFVIIGQLSGFRRGQLALYFSAVLLGAISAVLTLFAVILQEDVFQSMTRSHELVPGLIYCIAGIGLREETIKLLLFLPLVPILLKRGSEMEVLIVASMVGLGFALEENIAYFNRGVGSQDVAVGRFLTANFLHMSMTGLIGFACFRMIRFPKSHWEEFIATFLIVVCAHGIYDAVIMIPALGDISIVSIVILAMLALRFFGLSGSLSMTGSHQISPLGIFVIGTACIVGVSLNVVCFGQAPHPTYLRFGLTAVPMMPVAFLFVNQWRSS